MKGRRRKPLLRLGSYKPMTFRSWVVDTNYHLSKNHFFYSIPHSSATNQLRLTQTFLYLLLTILYNYHVSDSIKSHLTQTTFQSPLQMPCTLKSNQFLLSKILSLQAVRFYNSKFLCKHFYLQSFFSESKHNTLSGQVIHLHTMFILPFFKNFS